MVRKLFRASSIGLILMASEIYADMPVIDITSIKSMASQLDVATKSLQTLRTQFTQLNEMNQVLGGKLIPADLRQALNSFGAGSRDFEGLFASFTSPSGDPLRSANFVSKKYANTPDLSRHLYAKNYFKRKFFPEKKNLKSSGAIHHARKERTEEAENTTLDSLALVKRQKDMLEEDNKELNNLSAQAKKNSTIQYQANIQNKYSDLIAQRLDKLIWITSQILEHMAMQSLQNQPMVFTNTSAPEKKEK